MEPISFELNGFPKTLRNEAACRKAIEKKTLSPDTPILVYDDNGSRQKVLAQDHPVLRKLFGIKDKAEEPVEEAKETQEPSTDGLEKAVIKLPPSAPKNDAKPKISPSPTKPEVKSAAKTSTPTSTPPPQDPAVESKAETGSSGGLDDKPWLIPAIIGGVILLLILLTNSCGSDESSSNGTLAGDASQAVEEAAEQAAAGASGQPQNLDRTYNGDFGLVRDADVYREAGSSRIRTMRVGSKFFVRGTDGRYAYGHDEDYNYGFVAWNDINANPFDNRTYEFEFTNTTNDTIYLLVTFKVGSEWRVSQFELRPYTYGQPLRLSGRTAQVSSLETYYYRTSTRSRWNGLTAMTERTVRDRETNESNAKMTMIVPRIEGSRAYVEF